MPVICRAVEELNMLTATVHWHIHVYTYIYMHLSTDVFVCMCVVWCTYQCRILYVCVLYIVRICTYKRILTYSLYAKMLGVLICTYTYNIRVYVQYTYIILNYIRAYTLPVQNHHFSPCTYMHVYAVYSRINDRYTYFENIYVQCRYMHVYARICMYLHVYCCFHLGPLDQLQVSSYIYVAWDVRIWWYLYVYEVYARIVLVYAYISWNDT